MDYTIAYYSETVQDQITELPDTLAARYVVLTRRMVALGPNLGEPHTKAFGDGLFELRLKAVEGIARVFFCTLAGKRIVMLHSFVKKSERTPKREREIAEMRMKEPNVQTHSQLVKKLIRRPGVRAEVERIEREEGALLDALLKARQQAGLTQAQLAERMGTQAPAVARLERALATGKHSPSIATVRKYVKACGKRLVLRVA